MLYTHAHALKRACGIGFLYWELDLIALCELYWVKWRLWLFAQKSPHKIARLYIKQGGDDCSALVSELLLLFPSFPTISWSPVWLSRDARAVRLVLLTKLGTGQQLGGQASGNPRSCSCAGWPLRRFWDASISLLLKTCHQISTNGQRLDFEPVGRRCQVAWSGRVLFASGCNRPIAITAKKLMAIA
jgi:hypothetical protein